MSNEDAALCEHVFACARDVLAPGVSARDAGAPASAAARLRDAWQVAAELELLALPFPREVGGAGRNVLSATLALEAFGHGSGDAGLCFAIAAQLFSVQLPIFRFGSPEQVQGSLRRLCRGELIASHAMTEPGSGSDAFSLKTQARRDGEGYVLSGRKTFVTNGPAADLFLVYASTSPERGFLGVTAFLIERDRPGLAVGPPIAKLGLRAAPMCDLVLDECRVPAACRLGREGRGASVFDEAMRWERSLILAGHVGVLSHALDELVAFGRARARDGPPLEQGALHRIADMKVALEGCRGLTYAAAAALDGAPSDPWGRAIEPSAVKLHTAEALVHSALAAMEVVAGSADPIAGAVERHLRDAIGATLHSGTADVQRRAIARRLGL